MLLTIAAVLFVLWLLGVLGHVAGGFVHVILIIIAVVVLYDLLKNRNIS